MTLVKCDGSIITDGDRRWAREVVRFAKRGACTCGGKHGTNPDACGACKMYYNAMCIIGEDSTRHGKPRPSSGEDTESR